MNLKLIFILMVIVAAGCTDDSERTSSLDELTSAYMNSKVNCGSFQNVDNRNLPWKVSGVYDLVIMGSSTAAGAGAQDPQLSWANLIAKSDIASRAKVYNIAKGGHSTYNAVSSSCIVSPDRPKYSIDHNVDKAISLNPDVVVISYPSNDAAGGIPAMETASNLQLIRWQLVQKGAAVLVLSSQPRNMDKEKQSLLIQLNLLLKDKIGECFVDVYTPLVNSEGGLDKKYDSGDGVHPNALGHRVIFNALMDVLNKRKCIDIN